MVLGSPMDWPAMMPAKGVDMGAFPSPARPPSQSASGGSPRYLRLPSTEPQVKVVPSMCHGLLLNETSKAPAPAYLPMSFGAEAGTAPMYAISGSEHMVSLFGTGVKESGKRPPSLVHDSDGTGVLCPTLANATTETKRSANDASRFKSKHITSLMLCNIPCSVSQEHLAAIINIGGFHNRYDFLYLPKPAHGGTSQNLSYGFINLLTPEDTHEFNLRFQGYHFEGTLSPKVMQVKIARVQGFTNNVRNFRRSHHKDRRTRKFPLISDEQLFA